MAVRLVETTLVVVHGHVPPKDEDWEVFLEVWRRELERITAQLVISDGGAPNAEQRRTSLALIASRRGGPPPTAVVSASLLVRGAVTALSWFIKDRIRAFPPQSWSEACSFLGVARQEAALRETVRDLRQQLAHGGSSRPGSWT